MRKINLILPALLASFSAMLYAESTEKDIASLEYGSVESARVAVLKQSGVDIRSEHGWLIATDRPAGTIWTFTEEGQDAHPAVVKRVIVEEDGEIFIRMNVLCEAEKPACDKLVEQFHMLNEEIKRAMQEKAVSR